MSAEAIVVAKAAVWGILTGAIIALAELPEGSTECRPVAEAGDSWVIEDSKGCGFNQGVDPMFVLGKWVECEQAGGYDYESAYCSLWGIVPPDETD